MEHKTYRRAHLRPAGHLGEALTVRPHCFPEEHRNAVNSCARVSQARGSRHRIDPPPQADRAPNQPSPTTLQLAGFRSEEHTSELQSLMRISSAVSCLKKKNKLHINTSN